MKLANPLLISGLLAILPLHGQGPLAPPGAPAPTQKSLQEIWDKLQSTESAVATQQQQIALLQQQNTVLMEAAGVKLPWQLSTVEGSYSSPSLAFSPSGVPAVAYLGGNGELHYAIHNGNSWQISVVDGPELPMSGPSLAFDAAGNPMIAYHSDGFAGVNPEKGLKLAKWNGASWTRSIVEGGETGFNADLKLSPAGEPAVAYDSDEGEDTSDSLRFAIFTNGSWQFETVSTLPGVNHIPSLAFRQDGAPAIAFKDPGPPEVFPGNRGIYFAIKEGGIWITETIVEREDEEFTDEYSSPSLAFSPAGHATVCYDSYISQGEMNYAIRRYPNDWHSEPVYSSNDWGFKGTLVFNRAGQACIGFLTHPFYDETPSSLAYAVLKDDTWEFSYAGTLEFSNLAGNSNMAFGPNGQPAIAFSNPLDETIGFAIRGIFVSP